MFGIRTCITRICNKRSEVLYVCKIYCSIRKSCNLIGQLQVSDLLLYNLHVVPVGGYM